MNKDVLEKIVLETIKQEAKKILTLQDIDKLNDVDVCGVNNSVIVLKQTKTMLENKLLKVDKYLKKVYEDYIEELLSKEEYLDLKSQYNAEKQDVINQVREIDKSLIQASEIQETKDEWIEKFKNYIDVDELTRDMVVELIDRIEIGSNFEVHIFFKFQCDR